MIVPRLTSELRLARSQNVLTKVRRIGRVPGEMMVMNDFGIVVLGSTAVYGNPVRDRY